MSLFDRGQRGNVQNPFNSAGDAGSIGYSNPRLPQNFNGNVQLAIDALLDAAYPNYKATVPTKADLPATGNINDYYIVADDGDGKPAGYVWSDLGGTGWWNKRYDVDWSYEGLLSDAIDKTSAMYPAKYGSSDKDGNGNPYTGEQAGQYFFGGNQANESLFLYPNAQTQGGAVAIAGVLRPLQSSQFDLGDSNHYWKNLWLSNGVILNNQLQITPGIITDSSGEIDFQGTNIKSPKVTSDEADIGTLTFTGGNISDSSGQINFGTTNLETTGTLTAGEGSKLADFSFFNGQIQTASPTRDWGNTTFNNVGTLNANDVKSNTAEIGEVLIDGTSIQTNAQSNQLQLSSGIGGEQTQVLVQSQLNLSYDLSVGGDAHVGDTLFVNTAFSFNANALSLTMSGSTPTFSATANIAIAPAGYLQIGSSVLPDTDDSRELGGPSKRFAHLFLAEGISDGTTTVGISVLQSLRSINDGVVQGASLFWDGTKWVSSIPDTEIDHRTIGHLTDGDAGHTQFAMLSGRSGGQSLSGGTAASQSLTLDSTTNATKGFVLFNSVPAPVADNATDLGSSSRNFKDIYTLGVHKNLRFEAFSGVANYPANSGLKVGRAIYDPSVNQLLLDTGTAWTKVGQQKYLSDVAFDGNTASQTIDVSSVISDARTAIWQLCDNTNNFERVYAKLNFTQTLVTITASPPLPAGSYRLIGLN